METGTGSVIGDILLSIFFAAVIVIIGRTVVSWLVKLSRKLMVRANMDPILINFCSSIVNVLLLLFVLIAALDQLGGQYHVDDRRIGCCRPGSRIGIKRFFTEFCRRCDADFVPAIQDR